jgi:hypothetical protein
MKFYDLNLEKQIGYFNSSQKNTQFKKKLSVETESGKLSYEHFKFNSVSWVLRKKKT